MADARFLKIGLPIPWGVPVSSGTYSNFTISAAATANYRVFWTFTAKDAAVVTHLGFRYGARTGTPPAYKIEIYASSGSTGAPTGAALLTCTFTPPADTTWNGTWQWVAGDAAATYTLAMGTPYCIAITYSSGTISGANCSSFTQGTDAYNNRPGYPYPSQDDATSVNYEPIYGYKSASKAYGFPLQSTAQTQFSSTSTPDERALTVVIPSHWGASIQVAGIRFLGTTGAGGTTIGLNLYSGTTLQAGNVTIDCDRIRTGGSANRTMEYFFSSLVTLTPGTWRFALAPGASALLGIETLQFASAADLEALPGGSAAFYVSTRTDAGAWTDVTTDRLVMELILADQTQASGGGGAGIAVLTGGGLIR